MNMNSYTNNEQIQKQKKIKTKIMHKSKTNTQRSAILTRSCDDAIASPRRNPSFTPASAQWCALARLCLDCGRLTLISCGMAPLSNTLWIWLTDPAAMLLSVQHAYWTP